MTKAKISLVLRLLALGSTAAAIAIMVTSHETAKVLNLSFEAKYHNTPAFVYFVVAEAIAGGYSLVSLLLSCKTLVGRFVMMMDVVSESRNSLQLLVCVLSMNSPDQKQRTTHGAAGLDLKQAS
ncbi:hypothetical protein NL676_012899 [Syzygium grande]|nr:hypothetical protein NL676_012899 [Syzygium grande]